MTRREHSEIYLNFRKNAIEETEEFKSEPKKENVTVLNLTVGNRLN